MRKCFRESKTERDINKSCFLFPLPIAERGLNWIDGRIKNNLLGRGRISGAGSGSGVPSPALLLAAGSGQAQPKGQRGRRGKGGERERLGVVLSKCFPEFCKEVWLYRFISC